MGTQPLSILQFHFVDARARSLPNIMEEGFIIPGRGGVWPLVPCELSVTVEWHPSTTWPTLAPASLSSLSSMDYEEVDVAASIVDFFKSQYLIAGPLPLNVLLSFFPVFGLSQSATRSRHGLGVYVARIGASLSRGGGGNISFGRTIFM